MAVTEVVSHKSIVFEIETSPRWPLKEAQEGSFVKLKQLGNWETVFNYQIVSHIFGSCNNNIR